MRIPMATRYLPENRRDLQQSMVDHSQANFFAICVKLRLFGAQTIDGYALNRFSKKLFKLVMQRHTHLWT